MSHKVIEFTN